MGVDFLLGVLTLGIGWLVWGIFQLKNSQTPAGRMFDLQLVNSRTGNAPRVRVLIVRLVTLFLGGLYLVAGAIWGYGVLIDVGSYWLHSRAIPAFMISLIAVDLIAKVFAGNRRGLDRILHLDLRSVPSSRGAS